MQLKDWLLLFIPIIFDGFLVWIFQYIIKKRMEQQTTFKVLREEIFKTYIEKITQAIYACHNLYSVQAKTTDNKESLENLFAALDTLRVHVVELYSYFNIYKVILSTNKEVLSRHSVLKNRFEEWTLNWNNIEIQVSFVRDCEVMLQGIMDEGLKYIYGIRIRE